MQLVTTAQEIIGILSSRPDEEFYINELIRLTGRYPNSIEQALKKLAKQKLIFSKRMGNKKFFQINPEIDANFTSRLPQVNHFDWIKLLNRETAFAFNIYVCQSNVINLPKLYGVSVPTFWYNGLTQGVYYPESELDNLAHAISSKLEKDQNFARKDIARCYKSFRELLRFSKQIRTTNLATAERAKLQSLLLKFRDLYRDVFPYLTATHAIEMYFESQIQKQVPDPKIQHLLVSPVWTKDEERASALSLAHYAKHHGTSQKFEQLLKKHRESFCWLNMWSLNQEPLNLDYFRDEIENILTKVRNPLKEIRRLGAEEKIRQRQLKKILIKIKASPLLKSQVNLLQEYIFLRTYGKNTICQAHLDHLPLLFEIGSRLGLTNDEVRLASYEELVAGLKNKASAPALERVVKDRKNGWAILMWHGKITPITGVKKIVQAMEQYRIVPPPQLSEAVIHGQPACHGEVIGRVKVIHKLLELPKVQSGDILVTQMTTPDYMIAINKCAGIITDEGGVTCHAAIVSREFNLPCLIATHTATKVLNDNDVVELNATSGYVRIVQKSSTNAGVKKITGKSVYPGKISGKAVIVNDASDFPKVKSGQILVTSQATPDFLSCLYRVKGLVVDEDSLTSHAVLYANALKIPTIIGTENAREIITDGESLVLDATKGSLLRYNKP